MVDACIKTGQSRPSATDTGANDTNQLITTVLFHHQWTAAVTLQIEFSLHCEIIVD